MARLGPDAQRESRAAKRQCGSCSLCCTVLRVDELAKPAGQDCVHQRGTSGCGIHETRPPVCRGYACLWLQGGLEDDERPDRTGGVVDLEPRGASVVLSIRETRPGAFDASPALQAIAERFRVSMPVRVTGPRNTTDARAPIRVLQANGEEERREGEWVERWRDGERVERRRLGWAERLARRVGDRWRATDA